MALKVLVDEGMVENASAMGEYLLGRLRSVKNSAISEVRGRGLMIGVELHPEAGGARKVCEALLKKGVLCKETHQHVIRFAPPLIIRRDDIDWALERIVPVLEAI